MLKNVAHKKINKKREAALKNEVGGDEKHLPFYLALIKHRHHLSLFGGERIPSDT